MLFCIQVASLLICMNRGETVTDAEENDGPTEPSDGDVDNPELAAASLIAQVLVNSDPAAPSDDMDVDGSEHTEA